jgi:hypothetical protein
MQKPFKQKLELFDYFVRRLTNGNKIRIIFESEYDLKDEVNLIRFRQKWVYMKALQIIDPESASHIQSVEGKFEFIDVRCKHFANGDKLSLILECSYTSEMDLQLVVVRFQDMNVELSETEAPEEVQKELFGEEENEEIQEPDFNWIHEIAKKGKV